MKFYSVFVNRCEFCGDCLEAFEVCSNCESEKPYNPFTLADAIEKAESVSELYNLR